MKENPSSASPGRTASRLLGWTAAGTLLGIGLMPLYGLFTRYPLLNAFFQLCLLPTKAMLLFWNWLRLPPHGDAGFIMIAVFMVAEWSLIGLLVGLGRAWYLRRQARRPVAPDAAAPQRKTKRIGYAVLLLVAVVAGYCLYQEWVIAQDRRFFVQQVNHKEFAEACLDMVVHPDKYQLSFEQRDGNNPRLPEALRKLKPAHVSYQGYAIRIDKAVYHQGLMFTHSPTNPAEYEVVFRSNYKAPVHLYTLCSEQRPKSDWP